MSLTFEAHADGSGHSRLAVRPSSFTIAGWAARDQAAVDHHIAELAELGVPPPSTVPLYYRAGAALLTQADTVEALGPDSSGEVEPMVVFAGGRWWLTVGSDHTDRRVESYSVAVSKQMCPKPIASTAWAFDDVVDRQDGLRLVAWVEEGGQWVVYQSGELANLRPIRSLIDGALAALGQSAPLEGMVVSCGTLGVIPSAAGVGVRPAARMRLAIEDPVRGRQIRHEYQVAVLPIVA